MRVCFGEAEEMGSHTTVDLKVVRSVYAWDLPQWAAALKVSVIAGLLALLYARVLQSMVLDWWTEPSSSHGLLIPPLVAYIAWTNRRLTFAFPAAPDNRGLVVIFAACVFLLIGKLGAEFFLTRVSIVILLTGLAWTFWGFPRVRSLAFPLLLLVTMVPLPVLVYNSVAFPLQLVASHGATAFARFFGVTVYQEGNIIHLAGVTLGVAEACSGLRSLSSLIVTALLLGYLRCKRLRARITLVLLAIPIAISVNVFRVGATTILADYNEQFAMGFYHTFSGWLVFLVGMAVVFAASKASHALLD
jgi:exosortase